MYDLYWGGDRIMSGPIHTFYTKIIIGENLSDNVQYKDRIQKKIFNFYVGK